MSEPVTFTVVVPTYQRPERLRGCLAALAAQTHPRDAFEVVVVDDGSDEPQAPIAEPFADALDLRVHRQANAGPASARNAGAALARHSHLAFTDDDCAPAPGWLSALAAAVADAAGADGGDGVGERRGTMLGGRTVNALAGNPFADASQALVSYLYDAFAADPATAFFTSNNLAVPAAAFLDAGGFDTAFPLAAGEDRELCLRWVRGGGTLRYAPGAVVVHRHDLRARSYWRQHLAYGRGAAQLHARQAAAGAEPPRVQPPGFYRDMLRYPFTGADRRRTTTGAGIASALIAVAQVANAVGYVRERRADRSAGAARRGAGR